MKAKKKNRRLLFQVEVTTMLCFILAIIIIVFIAYKERSDAFVEDKKEHITRDAEQIVDTSADMLYASEWILDFSEKYHDEVNEEFKDGEIELYTDYSSKILSDFGIDTSKIEDSEELNKAARKNEKIISEKFEESPQDIKIIFVKYFCYLLSAISESESLSMDYKDSFFVDLRPESRGFVFAGNISDELSAKDNKYKINFNIDDVADSFYGGETDVIYKYIGFEDGVKGNEYFAAFKCFKISGKPLAALCLSYDMTGELHNLRERLITLMRVGIFFFLLIGFALVFFLYFAVLRPLLKIKESVAVYMDTKDSSSVTEIMKEMKSRNEIGVLAEDISELAIEIDRYTSENIKLAGEKQRVSTELDLASKIQTSMLSTAFPKRQEFEIFASMTPAKEVGGDFYDFFFIDENHLGLAIADVSGKGVPASLFMMISEILLREFAKTGISPKEVLEKLNSRISENNQNDMFVTVWFGIMDISTGHVTAANAGHEYPIIKKADGNFELFKDKHGLVIGAMEGIRYREYEFDIEKGGVLFVYTDGAAEATDKENKLFGTDRMIETLNCDPNRPPEMLIHTMKESIDKFVGEAPQFDDLTMLCIKYNGK